MTSCRAATLARARLAPIDGPVARGRADLGASLVSLDAQRSREGPFNYPLIRAWTRRYEGGSSLQGKPAGRVAPGQGFRYHSRSAAPQDSPPPNPHKRTRDPGRNRPASQAFSRVSGMLAAAVLPKLSTVVTVRSMDSSRRAISASIMRRLL